MQDNVTITEEAIRAQSSRILVEEADLPSWPNFKTAWRFSDWEEGDRRVVDAGQKNVVFKDPGNGVDNYRPTSCLPFMWILSTGGVVSESVYNFFIKSNFLPEEQRGCRKGS